MDYAEARAAFFSPREGAVQTLDWSSPARRLRDAIEPIATVCFWSEPSYDAYAARGLNFLQGYVWGRASALGEPEPGVVAAAFGVFEPGLVADLYLSGRATLPLAEMRAVRIEGVARSLAAVLEGSADTGEVDEAVAALRRAAASVSTTGRPFFAGWSGLDWPEDRWAQLWHACSLLRELRGDSHLAAVVSAGLDGVEANMLTELWIGYEPLAYTGSRAWSPEAMTDRSGGLERRNYVADGRLTDSGRRLREELETATDRAVQPAVDALGTDLDPLIDRLAGWSERIVERGWFPPDPYKRAAG